MHQFDGNFQGVLNNQFLFSGLVHDDLYNQQKNAVKKIQ